MWINEVVKKKGFRPRKSETFFHIKMISSKIDFPYRLIQEFYHILPVLGL